MATTNAQTFTIGGVTHQVEDVGARQLIADLQAALNAITSGDTTTAIKTFNEIIAFLNNIEDSSTLQGIIAGLNTAIAAKYTKPGTGIPASDLAQAVQTILNSVANKVEAVAGKGLSTNDFTTTLKKKLDDLPTADELKEELADKVKSVTINGQTKTPDQLTGDVDLGTVQGENGKSAYEVAVENGFVGTPSEWLASLIGNCAITGDGSNIVSLIVNNLTTGGAGNILSAEMGKQLGEQILAGSGTFAQAYAKSKGVSYSFPWMLVDEDENGNEVSKMIWHVGNRKFVDAVGSSISGKREGITIKSDGNGVLKLMGGGYEAKVNTTFPETTIIGNPAELPFSTGETTFDFDDIVNAFIDANQELYATAVAYNGSDTTLQNIYNAIKNYDGKTLSTSFSFYGQPNCEIIDVVVDDEDENKATYADIDFGGVVIKGQTIYRGRQDHEGRISVFYPQGNTIGNQLIRNLKRLNVDGKAVELFRNCSNLKSVELIGKCTSSLDLVRSASFGALRIEELDLSNFEFKSSCPTLRLLWDSNNKEYITKIDLRTFDTSNVTSFNDIFRTCPNLKTIIIGNFSNENVTTLGNFHTSIHISGDGKVSSCTLVCTTDTPPALNTDYDWIAGHFSFIKVPNKTIEVEGVEKTVLELYQEATGWSTYKDIMSTYEEGEY